MTNEDISTTDEDPTTRLMGDQRPAAQLKLRRWKAAAISAMIATVATTITAAITDGTTSQILDYAKDLTIIVMLGCVAISNYHAGYICGWLRAEWNLRMRLALQDTPQDIPTWSTHQPSPQGGRPKSKRDKRRK